MKKALMTFAIIALATQAWAYVPEIITSVEISNESVANVKKVEALYISPDQLTLHEEMIKIEGGELIDGKIVGGEVIGRSRINSITITPDETFTNPTDGIEYGIYEYFLNDVQVKVVTGLSLLDAVDETLKEYKALVVVLAQIESDRIAAEAQAELDSEEL